MNPFKAIGRGVKAAVTAPIDVARRTQRLLVLRARADDVLQLAEDAEADPRLYRDAAWRARLFTAAWRLFAVLPIASEVRVKFQDLFIKATMVVGAIGGLAGYLSDAGILQMLPPKYAATIGVVSGAAGTLAALLHKSPLAPKGPELPAEPTR